LLRHIADNYRGRVFSTIESMVWSTMMISMMVAGITSQYYSPRTIGAWAGVISSMTAIFWAWAHYTGRLPEPKLEGLDTNELDVLVNNAARFHRFDPLDITEADWDFIHSVNLKAVFFCCQQGARLMRKASGGRIVNISSLGGIRPWAEHAHYCASKAGVIMLTRALAKALAPEITVNSVAPGVIPFGPTDARVDAMIAATPAQRPGSAEEIADAVIYFLTATNFVTGQLLAVDGGLSQK